jgi:ferrous iron transport protein A
MSLETQKVGFEGTIKEISGDSIIVERLYEMGFVPGEEIQLLSKILFGEPYVVEVRGSSIALRKNEARCIEVASV